MTQYRLREGWSVTALPDGEAVVASEASGDAVIVNASAHALLELLASPQDEPSLVRVFVASFPGEPLEQLRQDVSALLRELTKIGVVEPCGGG